MEDQLNKVNIDEVNENSENSENEGAKTSEFALSEISSTNHALCKNTVAIGIQDQSELKGINAEGLDIDGRSSKIITDEILSNKEEKEHDDAEKAESNNSEDDNEDGTEEVGSNDTEDESDDTEGDEEEDESNDTEEDDEDDEPPLLKYTRIGKLPKSLFSRDSISACMFHDDFFMFGTHAGILHLTKTDFTPIRTFKCHRSSILSIHTEGTHFATASIDGTVVIGTIGDPTNVTAFDFKRPVQAVVLDHDYKNSKTFVSGGMAGEVILSQRNWLGNRIDTILAKGSGPIVGIYTMEDIILWMNDDGITFCSIHSKSKLLTVPFPQNSTKEIRPDLYRPHIHLPEVDRIIVGWCNFIWTFKVSLAKPVTPGTNIGSILSSAASSLRAVPDRKVELEHQFSIKMRIAGIASFKDDQLMCLGFSENDDEISSSNIPEIKIVDMLCGEDIYNDEIVFKDYKNLTLNDYHLGKHIENSSPQYFLISANDAIRIQVLTLEDHYKWFISKHDFLQAWKIGNYVVDDNARLDIGLKAIEELIDSDKWDDAASNLALIIANTNIYEDHRFESIAVKKWGQLLEKFIESGMSTCIAHRLPLKPQFEEPIYDGMLDFFLKRKDLGNFINLIEEWPNNFFSVRYFENELEVLIENHDPNEISYREAIIYLYLSENRFSKAIPHMLKARDMRALDLLLTTGIVSQFKDSVIRIILLPYNGNVSMLSELSVNEAQLIFHKPVELLVKNRHNLKVDEMVELLSRHKDLQMILFLYLRKISLIDPIACAPFENKLIELYARFDKDDLLRFLKSKSNYDTEKVIEFCSKQQGLSNELIYLWGKIGENKKALSLIIDDLNDPHLAISFVKNWGDKELWEFMIGYSMDKPKFVKALLDSPDEFGKAYLEVIKAMPTDMEIEGLQQTLSRISKNNALNLRVRNNILKIVDDETREVCDSFLKIRTLGKVFGIDD